MREAQLTATGFEELKRNPQTEECGKPLEAGKGRGQSLPESIQDVALDFSPMRPTQDSNLQNYKTVNLHDLTY